MADNTNITYTSLDFTSLRNDLLQVAITMFPNLNDFFESSTGMLFIELFAYVGAQIAFYQNFQANEVYIDRVRTRPNMVSLAELIGYTLGSASAAEALVNITLSHAVANNINIPVGFRISTPTGIIFTVQTPAVITAGQTSSTINTPGGILVKQAQYQTFSAIADGTVNFSITLPVTPFLNDGSEVVTVNAVTWTRVSNFLNSIATDQVYTVSEDDQGRGVITFGGQLMSGVQLGAIPSSGANISVSYQSSSGATGMVPSNSIIVFVDNLLDTLGNFVQATVSNPAPSTGGADQEDLELARVNAPSSVRTLSRTIARDDYENAAIKVAGIARAKAISSDDFILQDAMSPNVGDGINTIFTYTPSPAVQMIQGTVRIFVGVNFSGDFFIGDVVGFDVPIDSHHGSISGYGIVSGTVNYDTGSVTVTVATAPSNTDSIFIRFANASVPDLPENTVVVYLVPEVGGTASPTQVADVINVFQTTLPIPITQDLIVTSANYASFHITATVYKQSGVNPTTLKQAVSDAINAFFLPSGKTGTQFNRQFGETIYPSQIISLIQDVTGVAHVDVVDMHLVDENLPPITGLVGTPSITGGLIGTGNYYYRAVPIDIAGNVLPSLESSVVSVTGPNGSVALSWTAPVGVSIGSYRVYRTTTSGLYGANSYLGATASPVYTDTALATTTIPAVLTPITATINQLPIFDTLLDDIVII